MEDTTTATMTNVADVERAVCTVVKSDQQWWGGVRDECGIGNVLVPETFHRSPPNPIVAIPIVAEAACCDMIPRQKLQPQRNDVHIKIHGDGGDGKQGKHSEGGGRRAEGETQTEPFSGPLALWQLAGKVRPQPAPGEGWAVLQAVMTEEAMAGSTSMDDNSSSDGEGGQPNAKKSQKIHRLRNDSGREKGLARGCDSRVCHGHYLYRHLVTLVLCGAALGAGLTIGRRFVFTEDDEGEIPRHPPPQRPFLQFLPPPPADLAVACSQAGIATVDGLARCESACLMAEPCCWTTKAAAKVGADNTQRNCYGANRSACDAYRSHCHTVLGDTVAVDLSGGGDAAIVALPPPPSDLESLCSPGKILTEDGLALCESACLGASCCLLGVQGGEEKGDCYGGNEVACEIYREHCPVRP